MHILNNSSYHFLRGRFSNKIPRRRAFAGEVLFRGQTASQDVAAAVEAYLFHNFATEVMVKHKD